MEELLRFLQTSPTAYQATENARAYLIEHGFEPLNERETWRLGRGGKYFVERGGSAIVAFLVNGEDAFKIVASHTDSPCLKLKENPVSVAEGFAKLNAEPYGGGILYTFFDRPLLLAGRIVREKAGALVSENYVSGFRVVIPSLAAHMQRDVNEKFAPNAQIDLQPLLGMGEIDLNDLLGNFVSFDLYAVPAEAPFESGVRGEWVSSPRVDNLTSVFSSLEAIKEGGSGICVAACLNNEEIGSGTLSGAGGDFLRNVLERISLSLGKTRAEHCRMLSSSFLISLDNAHSVHPNHPEKCDPTNRAVLGGGAVIKSHAGGAYTTDALSSAIVKKIFDRAGAKYQTFFNRSDMRSGGTLGSILVRQTSMLSADIGLPQLAMHSAVETFAKSDYAELRKGLREFYATTIEIGENKVLFKP